MIGGDSPPEASDLPIGDPARGLWSDGEHMWVANREDANVYAYDLGSWDRVSGEDFDTLAAAGNSMPVDLWSDGQVMWILDKGDRKIYAYDLDSKVRLSIWTSRRFSGATAGPRGCGQTARTCGCLTSTTPGPTPM